MKNNADFDFEDEMLVGSIEEENNMKDDTQTQVKPETSEGCYPSSAAAENLFDQLLLPLKVNAFGEKAMDEENQKANEKETLLNCLKEENSRLIATNNELRRNSHGIREHFDHAQNMLQERSNIQKQFSEKGEEIDGVLNSMFNVFCNFQDTFSKLVTDYKFVDEQSAKYDELVKKKSVLENDCCSLEAELSIKDNALQDLLQKIEESKEEIAQLETIKSSVETEKTAILTEWNNLEVENKRLLEECKQLEQAHSFVIMPPPPPEQVLGKKQKWFSIPITEEAIVSNYANSLYTSVDIPLTFCEDDKETIADFSHF